LQQLDRLRIAAEQQNLGGKLVMIQVSQDLGQADQCPSCTGMLNEKKFFQLTISFCSGQISLGLL
jgi:hypothetical protein